MASADSPVWTAASNEALHLSLVRAKEDVLGDEEEFGEFHPRFTYPVRLSWLAW
jgi:histone acetyltransferase 1